MATRYFDSKLLEILYGRALAAAISSSSSSSSSPPKPLVAINMMNPGLCASDLFRDPNPAFKLQMKVMARSAEEGSRALVDAVGRGEDSHGAYLSDCRVARVSDFVLSKEGAKTQKRFGRRLMRSWRRFNRGSWGLSEGVRIVRFYRSIHEYIVSHA